MLQARFGASFAIVLAFFLFGILCCRPSGSGDGDGDGDTDSDSDSDADGDVTCTPYEISCVGNVARTCNSTGDGYNESLECTDNTATCVAGIGCLHCTPDMRFCSNNDVMDCNADGSSSSFIETCPDSAPCIHGACNDPCSQAEAANSYEGCEYQAVTLMNSQVEIDFVPAIVISNRNNDAVTVSVSRAGSQVAEVSVDPRSTQTVELPWVEELKQDITDKKDEFESVNIPHGSYQISSTSPVTIYQFNPLEYRLDRDCIGEEGKDIDGVCHSFSNDASLLLPEHVLTEHYIVMSRPSMGIHYHFESIYGDIEDFYSFSPSMLAVVNPYDHDITAEITFSAPTQIGPSLSAYESGQTGTFTIGPYGVLQMATRIPESCSADDYDPEIQYDHSWYLTRGYCNMVGYDFTGTEISASDPVAVFGGHNCDFIPYNRWACDHLEEQLFPYETWGTRFVLNQSHRENGEPDVFRVLSGVNGNTITFDPPSVHSQVTLGRGQFVEFEAHGAFEISADEPIMVGQYIVGQNYNDYDPGTFNPPGDPAFSLAVPVQQYRNTYNFLAPDTYDQSYVNITAADTGLNSIELDGRNLGGDAWQAVGGSGYSTLNLELDPGSHQMTAGTGVTFGITVYGYGQFTSYMFPGGLDLNEIAVW